MENIINWLKNNLSDERYRHSIATSEMAEKLAKEFGIDSEKAKLAGLLHDCAKEYSHEENLKIIKENNLDVDEDELKSKKVLHAPVSAFVAKTIFNIEDSRPICASSCMGANCAAASRGWKPSPSARVPISPAMA